MRRVLLVLVVLLALAAAAAGTVYKLAGSHERAKLLRRAHALVAALPVPRLIHLRVHPSLPNLSALERRLIERKGPNEELVATRVRASDALVRSSRFPQTTVVKRDRGPVTIFGQTEVDKGHGIYIAEPDLAANGNRVLVTWNDGAAFSQDGGRSFGFVDPAQAFESAHAGFCCDQSAIYDAKNDLWIWVLQYWPDKGGNILRLVVGRGDNGFDQHDFHSVSLAPTDYGFGTQTARGLVSDGSSFDYPQLALTNQKLVLAVNVFGPTNKTLVVRVPLSALAGAKPTLKGADFLTLAPRTVGLTAGATDTIYFASHDSTSALRLWSWPDDSKTASSVRIPHSRYPYARNKAFSCRRRGGPVAGDWCERLLRDGPTNDDRPTAAWVSRGVIGVAWNAQQDRSRGFPYPFVMVVRIDEKTKRLLDEPFIWNRRYAYEFLTAAPNAQGDLGGLVLSGGGTDYESCTALASAARKSRWDARLAARSDHDPEDAQSGDYLGVVPGQAAANSWLGSCMILQGGRGPENIAVRVVSFGRRG